MPFKTELQMKHIKGTEMYKLLSPLVYRTWKDIKRVVPRKYPSDGHSIPKLLRSIAGSPFASTTVEAAWYHDYLCGTLVKQGKMSRREADSEYSHALSDLGWNKKGGFWKTVKRKRNYLGVRFGAGLKWFSGLFKKRKQKIKNPTPSTHLP